MGVWYYLVSIECRTTRILRITWNTLLSPRYKLIPSAYYEVLKRARAQTRKGRWAADDSGTGRGRWWTCAHNNRGLLLSLWFIVGMYLVAVYATVARISLRSQHTCVLIRLFVWLTTFKSLHLLHSRFVQLVTLVYLLHCIYVIACLNVSLKVR